MTTKNHDEVYVWAPHKGRRRLVHVDELMAPFLKELWERGYETTGSCQEFRPGLARIWFRFGEDKARFLAKYPGSEDSGSGAVDFPIKYLVQVSESPSP